MYIHVYTCIYIYTHVYPVIFQLFSGHFPVIFRSFSGHFPLIFRSLSGHFPVIFQSFSGHFPVIFRSSSGHFPIIIQTFSGHFPVIIRPRTGPDWIFVAQTGPDRTGFGKSMFFLARTGPDFLDRFFLWPGSDRTGPNLPCLKPLDLMPVDPYPWTRIPFSTLALRPLHFDPQTHRPLSR